MTGPTWKVKCTPDQWPVLVGALYTLSDRSGSRALLDINADVDAGFAALLVQTLHRQGASLEEIASMVDAPREVLTRWILR